MYRSTDDRIEYLEQQINRQAFQIKLLHAIIQNKEKASIYELLLHLQLTEKSFNQLKKITAYYETQLNDGFTVSLSMYIHEVQKIFTENNESIYTHDLSTFIPKWLGGTDGNNGFSQSLHSHFYK